jgi:hypothetical protein
MDFPDRVMLGVFNLSHDDWPEVRWEVHLPAGLPRTVKRLGQDGEWHDAHAACELAAPDRVRLTVPGSLSFRFPLVLRLA